MKCISTLKFDCYYVTKDTAKRILSAMEFSEEYWGKAFWKDNKMYGYAGEDGIYFGYEGRMNNFYPYESYLVDGLERWELYVTKEDFEENYSICE